MALCFQSPLKPTTPLALNLSTTNNPKPSIFKRNFPLPTTKSVPSTTFTNPALRSFYYDFYYDFYGLQGCAIVDSLREDVDVDGLRYIDDLCLNPYAHPGEVSNSETTELFGGKLIAKRPVLAFCPATVPDPGPGFEFLRAGGISALSLLKGLPLGSSAVAVNELFWAKFSRSCADNIARSFMGRVVLIGRYDPLELKRWTFWENRGGVVYMDPNKFPQMVSSLYGGNVLGIKQKRGSSPGLLPMHPTPLTWGNVLGIKPNRSSSLAKHFVAHSSSGGFGGSSSDGCSKSSEDSSKGSSHWSQFLPGFALCCIAIGLGVMSHKGMLNKELFAEIKYFLEIVASLLVTIKAASLFNKNNS